MYKMATKVRFKYVELLWILSVVCCGLHVQCRPNNANNFITTSSDDSDRTLVRVLRSEFEEEENEETLNEKAKAIPKANVHAPHIKKRASEEDQFFQALLSRANNKPIEKRSYESQPEKDEVHNNWKGDSKISDADKRELEHLFDSIGMVDEKGSKEKIDAKRATKTGVDGKVQELVEWLMAKPPREFHESLRSIIDVERQVSDLFAFAPGEALVTTPDATLANDGTTTTTETTETTSPAATITSETGDPTSISPPISDTASTTAATTTQSPAQTSYTATQEQPMTQAFPAALSPAFSAPSTPAIPASLPAAQQTLPQPPLPAPLLKDGKPRNVYADVAQTSKMLAKTGPGPIPPEALDYFNKFSGGIYPVRPQGSTNGAHAPELQTQAAVLQQAQASTAVQAVAPQFPAVGQQAPAVPQQRQTAAAQSAYSGQYQHASYPGQYANPYQNQNSYYGQYNRQQADGSPKPYRPRGSGYTPAPQRPYPMNKEELDEPTDKKKSVTASLLFKQNWSDEFLDRKSTKSRVFREDFRKELLQTIGSHKKVKNVKIKIIKEDRGKVGVTFSVVYTKKTKKPLEPLYDAIVRDALGTMPVYRDTLERKGKAHLKAVRHRSNKMDKSQSENPATEFAKFADEVDKQMTGENLPLNEKHEAYQGCFKDKKPNRDMRKHFSKFEMTPEWCVNTCKKEGYRFAGVQYSYLCFCGNKFGRYGRVTDSECNSRCYGDKNRFCGAFWHSSIYSIDGQHHDLGEFSAVPDDEPDEEEENDEEQVTKKPVQESEEQHAKVANHLMEAASSALKAAKKLLPGKNEHKTEAEFTKHKRDAEKSLEAVDNIVKSTKEVQKRSLESPDGRNLLMAYLGNVGGYDREYRSVEDEDKPVEKIKFDYKREIIDEEGDGEFVYKPQKKKQLHRSRRSLETEEFDGRKKMALRAVEDSVDVTNPKSAVAEPSRRELLSQDSSDKEIKRRSRDTEEEEEEEEILKNKKSKSRKRSVGFDRSLYHTKVEEGVENMVGGVVDVMKGTSTMGLFKEAFERVSTEVMNGLAVPDDQKDQVNREVRADIKETGISRANSLIASIRTELNEYGELHPAIGPQADEAAKTFADIPLDQGKADEIKNKIRKRSVDDDEDKDKSFLSDILLEHFKHNN